MTITINIVLKGLFSTVRAKDGAEYQSDKLLSKLNRTIDSTFKTNSIDNLNKVDRNVKIKKLSHKDGAHTLGFKLINVPP